MSVLLAVTNDISKRKKSTCKLVNCCQLFTIYIFSAGSLPSVVLMFRGVGGLEYTSLIEENKTGISRPFSADSGPFAL